MVLQLVCHPPVRCEIWLYCDCAPPTISEASSLSLDMGYILSVGSSVLLSIVVQLLVVILVLLQEEMSARPSILASSTGSPFHIQTVLFPFGNWTIMNIYRYVPSHIKFDQKSVNLFKSDTWKINVKYQLIIKIKILLFYLE